jgi:hypothetical protein
MASAAYAWAVLLHLLSVTFLPFLMLAVGRYDVPAAVWIYGANMILYYTCRPSPSAYRRTR